MTKKSQYTNLKVILSKIHRVNLDLMKKVVVTQKFQSDIRKIRSYFGISNNGFQNDEENKSWHESMYEQADTAFEKNKDYREVLKKIWVKKEKGEYKRLSDYEYELKMVNNTYVLLNYFNQRIKEVVLNNKLPMHFEEHVRRYVFFNKITAPSTNHAITFNSDKKYFAVAIYNKPTRDEWKIIKDEVEVQLNIAKNKKFKFLSKFHYPFGDIDLHPLRKFDRDIKIMESSNNKNKIMHDKEGNYIWQDQDIATECLPENATTKDVNKFIPNIRKIRSRMKKLSNSS